jgi:hypothetical protein
MDDNGQTTAKMPTQTTAPAPSPPNPPLVGDPPPSPAAIVQKALAALNHPTNLDLQSRMAAIEHALRVLCGQLIPLLPTE